MSLSTARSHNVPLFNQLAVFLFFGALVSGGEPGKPTIEIQPDGGARTDKDGSYLAGRPMFLKVVVSAGAVLTAIDLKDHDEYHGTLEYPTSVAVRVVAEGGQVLTANDLSNDEWWSWYYLWSTLFNEMPGDTISLGPGERLVRKIPVAVVLRGCPGLEDGLKPGAYRVQLRIDGVLSNELRITVRAAD